MTALQSSVSVLAMDLPWMPGAERVVVVPEGLSVAEMVERAFPGASEDICARVRVVMARDGRHVVVPRRHWRRVYPHGGTQVVVQLAPGQGLRSILQVIISVAAIAIANFFAPGIGTALGLSETFVKGIITLGLTALGGILLNAMFKDKKEEQDRATPAAFGWRNAFNPDGAVPVLFGEIRVAPPHAAGSYVDIVGEEVHLRAAFDFGYGPLEFGGRQRIGDTPAADFQEFSQHTVSGLPDDPAMQLYRRQMIPEEVGVDLERPWPRDPDGKVRDDLPPVSTPVRRISAYDVSRIINILAFPTGLGYIDNKGRRRAFTAVFRRRIRLDGADVVFVTLDAMGADLDHAADTRAFVEQDLVDRYWRKVGDTGTGSWVPDWIELDNLSITHRKYAGFFRSDIIDLPERGRWMVEYERLTRSEPPENTENSEFLTTQWQILQSFRPEYPIVMDRPLALTSALVKSTTKLRGTLDSFNDVPRRVARDWNGEAWVWRATRNPASAALFALTGPATARPAPDAGIDWTAFVAFHEHCALHGLTYDAFHDQDGEGLEDALKAIGSAGRAAIYHDGYLWTVYIDRPSDLVAGHVNARNAWGLKVTASFFRPTDGHRVRFQDRLADYEWRTRVVPWPPDVRFATRADLEADLDHRGGTRAETHADPDPANNRYWRKIGAAGEGSWEPWPLDEIEDMDLRGYTDASLVWVEARRRQYEARYRSSVWTAMMAGTLTAPRIGDQVLASRDFLARTASAARVVSVAGDMVVIDGTFTMEAGTDYAIRFRVDETDTDLGRSVVRTIATVPGDRQALTLTGGSETGDASLKPIAGQIVQFGPAGRDAVLLVTTEVTRTEDGNSSCTWLPAAPIIDALTDAEVPPPWTGRVGEIVGGAGEVPMPPVVTGVLTGVAGTGEAGGLVVLLSVAIGETAEVARYDLRHKLSGAGSWADIESAPITAGSVDVPGYDSGDEVTFQARAVSLDELESEWGPEITVTIGEDDAEVPGLPTIDAGGNLGHAWIDVLVPAGDSAIAIELYARSAAGDLDLETDLVRSINVTPGVPLAVSDGDTTRVNAMLDPGFATGAPWSFGGGWAHDTDKATKSSGSTLTYVDQPVTVSAGDVVRFQFDLVAFTSNSVRAGMTGGTEVVSADFYNAVGTHRGFMTAVSGNNRFGIRGSNFRGSIDNVVMYRATPTTLPQGTRRYWVRGVNIDGTPGPIAGPVTVTII